MTTPDYDTNPSTPTSKRASEPRVEAAVPAALPDGGRESRLSRPTTDPGVAPPPGMLPAAPKVPRRIVVPSVSPPPNDSIDVLLDGISRDQPEGSRSTPQTEGQSAASYHGEHAIPAAQMPTSDEPKVVIERAPLTRTIRLPRSAVAASFVDTKASAETTTVKSQSVAGRVTLAVVAAVFVVVGIFVALRRLAPETSAAPAADLAPSREPSLAAASPAPLSAVTSANTAPPAAAVSVGTAPALAVAMAPIPSENPSAAAATGNPTRKASAAAPRPSRSKPRPVASVQKTLGGDLGEFKASF